MWLGIAAGYASALAFGLDTGEPSAVEADWRHVGSAAVALGLTTAAMFATRVEHPSACAAALLVALGIWDPWQIAALGGGAVILAGIGIVLNRLAGLPYPLWSHRPEEASWGRSRDARGSPGRGRSAPGSEGFRSAVPT
jgi:CBS domain-containing membrane protein